MLTHLPRPYKIRPDPKGVFRAHGCVEFLESLGIMIDPIASEAPWQAGKHSRHIDLLKEHTTRLSQELGPDVRPKELLTLALNAKNEMHTVRGYSPYRWVFGKSKSLINFLLQEGNQLPSLRAAVDFGQKDVSRS